MRHLHLVLRPTIYVRPNEVIAYEVDGMPPGQKAGITRTDAGDWEIVWSIGGETVHIREKFQTADAACRALTEAIRTR